MTEEEKEEKIIQDLKIEIERLKKIATYPTGTYVTFEGLTLLSNIIEKKDIEITKLKKHNKDLLRKLRNRVKEVKKLTKYSLYKREFTTLNKQLQQKDKMMDLIKEEVRDHIGFENRLKRDKREPDMFNQGRFYVANNINNILKGK